jgi:hypothetical protein
MTANQPRLFRQVPSLLDLLKLCQKRRGWWWLEDDEIVIRLSWSAALFFVRCRSCCSNERVCQIRNHSVMSLNVVPSLHNFYYMFSTRETSHILYMFIRTTVWHSRYTTDASQNPMCIHMLYSYMNTLLSYDVYIYLRSTPSTRNATCAFGRT